MPVYDATTADCRVFTFKQGLLSPIAHDLQIRVSRLTVDVSDDARTIRASFDPRSLEVVCAMRDGREDHQALGEADRRKIERNIREDVLEVERHREIRFESDEVAREDGQAVVRGRLHLHGRERALTVTATREGSAWRAEVSLHQPDFGITPYTAMLGTLRVRADLLVRLRLAETAANR